ncbi:MAG: VWA domain-containing protein [Phycisphaerales bacterium]|nr:VWA domain-containing protein [Phycisphaerales bacterium]
MKGIWRIGFLSTAGLVLIGAVLYGCESNRARPTAERMQAVPLSGSLAAEENRYAGDRDRNALGVATNADEVWIIEKQVDASKPERRLKVLSEDTPAPAAPAEPGLDRLVDPSRLTEHELKGLARKDATSDDALLAPGFRQHPDENRITRDLTYPTAQDIGAGALCCVVPNEPRVIPVPLEHTDVKASIAGYIGSVNVKQQYHNPFDVKIEATYVFPLPDDAAVNDFVMTIGNRTIRGIIREREEALQLYNQARAQGYTASLLQQERPNIFMQKVANIEPGKRIDIDITYYHTLAYDDGWYEWVFPMTVGPRYNPQGFHDGVGAAPRGVAGQTGQATEVQYLAPNERSGHDIALQLDIEAGVPIEEIVCKSHVIEQRAYSASRTLVELAGADSIPNKDFVLRYRVAGDRVKTGFLTHRTDRGSYFTFMMYPPSSLRDLERGPVELIFVLDCSGSMSGRPIEQAKAAIERGLSHLRPEDSFQIIRFSHNASQLGARPLAATAENIERGKQYLASLHGGGGTEMIEGIKAALDFPHDDNRLRYVVFATDGFIGSEQQILSAMSTRLGAARVFSFGVGQAPNRYLMDRMASVGRGVAAYISLNDSAVDAMDRFFERVSHPAMSEIAIDWDAFGATQVFPANAPDLFVGRPVVFTGKLDGDMPGELVVTGRVGGKERVLHIDVTRGETADHPALAAVWARNAIKDLTSRSVYETINDLQGTVRTLALEYRLVSAYTSFVAVDSLVRTDGDHGISVTVPVHVPEGVRYDTTVGARGGS